MEIMFIINITIIKPTLATYGQHCKHSIRNITSQPYHQLLRLTC